jgi:DNA invertase Pin-like site-specific DNA recombinase
MDLEVPRTPIRAAEYVRMSTDYQKYSIENQSEAMRAYAACHGMEIVRTYADKGKSGLKLAGRNDLKRLLADVLSGSADFSVILVYDVSRWGRFQDADESAHYEYICKQAGFSVHYCAEQFENDGSLFAAIVKSVKRGMAGEYSRELSVKVFAGQRRIVELGYRLGSHPGYGLRRMLVDQTGVHKCVLARGERKSIQTDHTILVPGPPNEVSTVRWIYSTFVVDRKRPREIAAILNRDGITTDFGRPWTDHAVLRVLTNEKYIGNSVWNRTSGKLRNKRLRNDPGKWIRAVDVFEPIVDRSLFEAARAIIREPSDRYRIPKENMLVALQKLLQKRGLLNQKIINESKGVPSTGSYYRSFGSLRRAYRLIGYDPYRNFSPRPHGLSDDELLEVLRKALKERGRVSQAILDGSNEFPSYHAFRVCFGGLSKAYQQIGYTPDRIRRQRPRNISDGVMLEMLQGLLRKYGRLSSEIIDEDVAVPSVFVYVKRFGSLSRAYGLIGYAASRRARWENGKTGRVARR